MKEKNSVRVKGCKSIRVEELEGGELGRLFSGAGLLGDRGGGRCCAATRPRLGFGRAGCSGLARRAGANRSPRRPRRLRLCRCRETRLAEETCRQSRFDRGGNSRDALPGL